MIGDKKLKGIAVAVLVSAILAIAYVPITVEMNKTCAERFGANSSETFEEYTLHRPFFTIGRTISISRKETENSKAEKVMFFNGNLVENFNDGVTCTSDVYPYCVSNVEFYVNYAEASSWFGHPSMPLSFVSNSTKLEYDGRIDFAFFSKQLLFQMNVTNQLAEETTEIEFTVESDVFRFAFQWWRRDFEVKQVGGKDDGRLLAVGYKNLLTFGYEEYKYCIDPNMPSESKHLFSLMPFLTVSFALAIDK